MYVAGRVLKVERPEGSGNYVEVKVGEPVPECTTWSTFKACLNTGHVVWQPESGQTKAPPGVPPSAIKPVDAAPAIRTKPRASKKAS